MNPKTLQVEILAAALMAEKPVLREKIATAVPCAEAEAMPVLAEVLRFMALIAWSKQRLTPPLKIDVAWHEFILCTRLYQRFCHQHFGRFIHHDPGGESADHARGYRKTLQLYSLVFGNADQALWGHGALEAELTCGACEASPEIASLLPP